MAPPTTSVAQATASATEATTSATEGLVTVLVIRSLDEGTREVAAIWVRHEHLAVVELSAPS